MAAAAQPGTGVSPEIEERRVCISVGDPNRGFLAKPGEVMTFRQLSVRYRPVGGSVSPNAQGLDLEDIWNSMSPAADAPRTVDSSRLAGEDEELIAEEPRNRVEPEEENVNWALKNQFPPADQRPHPEGRRGLHGIGEQSHWFCSVGCYRRWLA